MAENITLGTVSTFTNDSSAVATVNNNSVLIQNAFQNVLDRNGTAPNAMNAVLDMNSFNIINLPSPATVNSPARLVDVVSNPTITVPPVGTSGSTVPLLDGNNTFSGNDIFSGNNTYSGSSTFTGTVTLPTQNYITINPVLYGADPTGVTFSDSAITAILAAYSSKDVAIEFPTGLFKFNAQISIPIIHGLVFKGSGSNNTFLYWPAGGGISATVLDGFKTVNFSGMTLLTGTAGGNSAITVTGSGPQVSNLQNLFEDITCMGFDLYSRISQTFYWTYGISTILLNNVNYRSILVYGSSGNLGGGINAAGASANFAIIHNISDSSFFNTAIGFLYGTLLQGVTIRNCNFTNGVVGISVPALSSGTFQLSVSDSQFNVTANAIDISSDITSITIANNLFFVPGSQGGVVIGGGRQYTITGNVFIPFNGSVHTGVIVNVNDSTSSNIISGNAFGGQALALNFGVSLNGGSRNWTLGPNNYNNVTFPATNTGVGNTGSDLDVVGTFIANGVTPVTVSAPSVTSSSQIDITLKTVGGTVSATRPNVLTITPGTGFDVGALASDTSTYNYKVRG